MDRWMDGRSFGWFWLVALPLCYYRFFCCCRCLPFRFRVLLSSLLKYKLRTANDTCAVCMVEIPENNTNNNSNSNRNDSSSSSGNSTNEKKNHIRFKSPFSFRGSIQMFVYTVKIEIWVFRQRDKVQKCVPLIRRERLGGSAHKISKS